MDYSNFNTSLWNMVIQLGIIALAIIVATILKRKIKPIANTLMPTAVMAGFFLLILRSTGILRMNVNFLEVLVYHGIALGFIAMSLRVPERSSASPGAHVGLKSGAIIIGSYTIQAVTGLVITIALGYTLFKDLFKAAGILLPMGFGQGPGQANNVGSTYEAAGFIGGRSFGLSIAAAGYLCACIVGVIVINMLIRSGKIKRAKGEAESGSVTIDMFQHNNEIPISESIDKLSIQVAFVLLVYFATYLVTWGITSALTKYLPAAGEALNTLLWGFNFIIGSMLAMLMQRAMGALKSAKLMTRQYQNNYLLNRISGLFFDIMIVAGIASINVSDLRELWVPFIILAVAGGFVTWFYLKVVCRKVYGDYYYEGLLSMYGMMTGTISSGVLLLREIDPEMKSPAATNLVTGSSFGIVLGAPMLVLIGMAYKSDIMTFATLGLCVVYFALMMLIVYKVRDKRAK